MAIQSREAIRAGSYVAGEWFEPKTEKLIRVVNPAKPDEVLAEFPAAGREDTLRAIEVAQAAWPEWRDTPAPERGRVLWRAADIARRRLEEIARTMSLEEGKIIRESRGEVMKGVALLEYYAGAGFRISGKTLPSESRDTHTYTLRRPLGVVGLITPWNFPWAIPVWKAAPALVAGNAVVFKPASLTPGTAAILMEILEEAGLPAGVANMVVGSGSEVGNTIVDDPRIAAVSFTGSNSVGMGVNTRASQRGARVTCEMGGKNAVVVMNDADLDAAATAIVGGAFGATGQRCTATSRLVVERDVKNELLERLVAKAKALTLGPGLDEASDLAPAVDRKQFETDLQYIEIARSEGARLVYGGKAVDLGGGYFVEPTLFDGVTPDMRIFREEVFGPVLVVSEVSGLDEAIAAANAVEFGLAAAIFSQDNRSIMRFIEESEVGMVHVNEPTIGGEAQLPFGGAKSTGVGPREMGEEGLHFFTELKTVFVNYSGSGERALIR
ncbi:MAG TPA: aldehyde dehydrogenase family protein [Trueperaceae bacterium]